MAPPPNSPFGQTPAKLLGAAGLIDSTNIDSAIFGTGKFYKERQNDKKEDIYSNIDEMLNSTLDSEENK